VNINKIKIILLQAVADAFIATLDKELGDLFGPEQTKAWTMFFHGLTKDKINIQSSKAPSTR